MTYSSFVSDRSPRKSTDSNHRPTNNRVLSADDAFTYIRVVKEAFEGRPAKYEEFLVIMNDFKSQRIGISEVTSRVKQLFSDNPELILGFNFFLPRGHKIHVGLEELATYFVRDMSLDDN